MTKILAPIERLFTPYALIAINVVIILLAEFTGRGRFFAETGLIHFISVIFVGLIIVRIFSDYAFSDYILKGFLKIQLAFFLFLGLVHVYEYLGLHIFMLDSEVVELSVATSYLLWFLGIVLATGFVFRIYHRRSAIYTAIPWMAIAVIFVGLVGANVSSTFAQRLPGWVPLTILAGTIIFSAKGILSTRKIIEIMPVFKEYSRYAVPAMLLLVLAAFAEYFESTGSLEALGVSEVQILYLAHFLMHAVLSFLLVAFGKLKKPTGIYAEM